MGFQQGLQATIFKSLAAFIYRGNAFPIIVTCCDQIVHLKPPLNRVFVLRKHSSVLLDTMLRQQTREKMIYTQKTT